MGKLVIKAHISEEDKVENQKQKLLSHLHFSSSQLSILKSLSPSRTFNSESNATKSPGLGRYRNVYGWFCYRLPYKRRRAMNFMIHFWSIFNSFQTSLRSPDALQTCRVHFHFQRSIWLSQTCFSSLSKQETQFSKVHSSRSLPIAHLCLSSFVPSRAFRACALFTDLYRSRSLAVFSTLRPSEMKNNLAILTNTPIPRNDSWISSAEKIHIQHKRLCQKHLPPTVRLSSIAVLALE